MTYASYGYPGVTIGGVHKGHAHSHSHHSGDRKSMPLPASPHTASRTSSSCSYSSETSDSLLSSQDESDSALYAPGPIHPHDSFLCGKHRPLETVTRALPTISISRSNRRSLSQSTAMLHEKMSYRPMGRSRDGTLRYAIYMEESHGFRWNKNIQRLHTKILDGSHQEHMDGYLDLGSDDEEDFTDDDYDDSYDDEPSHEPVTLLN